VGVGCGGLRGGGVGVGGGGSLIGRGIPAYLVLIRGTTGRRWMGLRFFFLSSFF